MPTPDNEPKAPAVNLFSEIISYVKQSTPTRSNDTSTQGFVYLQRRVGQMSLPRDFARPWSPVGQLSSTAPTAPRRLREMLDPGLFARAARERPITSAAPTGAIA